MGRLIDADALIEEINKATFTKDVNIMNANDNGPQLNGFYKGYTEAMVRLQPTAYNVEKVAEDLQKASMIIEQNENSIKCAIEENMAVHIVKRGGL